jgi:glycosyltransferase involved in cell wall biosynthesis
MQSILKKLLRAAFDIAVWITCGVALALFPARLLRKLLTRRVFSLWAGTPIITMATNACAERLLGVNAKSLVFSTYYITDEFDYNLSRFAAIPVLGRVVPLGVFVWACMAVDRLHFYCDRGILPSKKPFTLDIRELYVYRLLGIDVFLWAYGADVRNQQTSRAMGYPNPCTDCDAPGRYCLCDERQAAENMRNLSRLSRAIFAGVGEMFGYTPNSIDDVFYWPLDFEADLGERYRPVFPDPADDRPLRIVHASNHRMFKGTRFLIDAVEQLQAEGESVELVLVERVPNDRALELYRSADVIFDQCLMGNYGFFALEGMALGKPVMCFVREPTQYLLKPDECPIINTHISTLKEDIRQLARGRAQLSEIGRRSRRYVETYFSLPAFAHRLSTTYASLGITV